MTNRLKFDVQKFYEKAKTMKGNIKVDSATINLPFISINFSANNKEQKIAREIIIRIKNKRVLNSKECCENCIENSLKSIIDIRQILVDKQVDIEKIDSVLFLLADIALYGIKEFLTYTETFDCSQNKQAYFEALNIIRGHLLRTFDQIAKIANLPLDYGFRHDFIEAWEKETYILTK